VLVVYLISPRGVKRHRLNGLGSRIVPFGQDAQNQRSSRFRSDSMCQEIDGVNSPTMHLPFVSELYADFTPAIPPEHYGPPQILYGAVWGS
jgi:hypothetical protein